MVTLRVLDPSGYAEVSKNHASRPPSLAGKRIGFLTNEQWQSYFALPALKAQLESDFPDAEVLAVDALPKGNEAISKEETAALIRGQAVDAVIIGSAA